MVRQPAPTPRKNPNWDPARGPAPAGSGTIRRAGGRCRSILDRSVLDRSFIETTSIARGVGADHGSFAWSECDPGRCPASAVLLRRTGFAVRHGTVATVERRHNARFKPFIARAGAGIGNGETLERHAEIDRTP